jgi:p-hydroxybenzoate 3-monooxygenase
VRTQVGIIGAGPAGLMLSHLLHRAGIASVVVERRSRDYITRRVRAGVLEQGTVELLSATGLGDRLHREGLVHHGIELRFGGRAHRIPLSDLTGGRAITIYGQQEVVKDLIDARLASGGVIHFTADDVTLSDVESDSPRLTFVADGERHDLVCEYVAGCDGFHGIARQAIPAGILQTYERVYPFGWVGILAEVAPSNDELIYAHHRRGFALHSLRSPELSRLYVQCGADDTIEEWSDRRIWDELHARFAVHTGWTLAEGPILEKNITPMRSFVAEPMRYGRLFLAGDAAHIVPPTGAKGLNLAMSDVRVLAAGFIERYRTGLTARLDAYSGTCLARVWKVQHFSYWMTSMLHRFPDDASGVQERLQLGQLAYLADSRAAQTSLAENYVGLPDDGPIDPSQNL